MLHGTAELHQKQFMETNIFKYLLKDLADKPGLTAKGLKGSRNRWMRGDLLRSTQKENYYLMWPVSRIMNPLEFSYTLTAILINSVNLLISGSTLVWHCRFAQLKVEMKQEYLSKGPQAAHRKHQSYYCVTDCICACFNMLIIHNLSVF